MDPGLVDPSFFFYRSDPRFGGPGFGSDFFKYGPRYFPENLVDPGLVDPGSEKLTITLVGVTHFGVVRRR